MSDRRPYSPLTDAMGCLTNLYTFIGSIYGLFVYGAVILDLLVRGDLCSLIMWISLVGPVVVTLASLLWPLGIMYFPLGDWL